MLQRVQFTTQYTPGIWDESNRRKALTCRDDVMYSDIPVGGDGTVKTYTVKICPYSIPGFESRTVQPVVGRYTD
jgi:hypothetical protein